MRYIYGLLMAGLLATPALADETEGLILGFDRVDRIIVLEDKTVWQLPESIDVPADLGRGDRVLIDFDSEGEDGISEITALERLAVALPDGTDGGS
jgi:hypothetical protein